MIKIRLGMFDHAPLKYVEQKIYKGCELRDDYTGWNVSTELESLNDLNRRLNYK